MAMAFLRVLDLRGDEVGFTWNRWEGSGVTVDPCDWPAAIVLLGAGECSDGMALEAGKAPMWVLGTGGCSPVVPGFAGVRGQGSSPCT